MTFNTRKNLMDRALLRFHLDERGKFLDVAFSSAQSYTGGMRRRSKDRGKEF